MRKGLFSLSLLLTLILGGGFGWLSVNYPQITVSQEITSEAESQVLQTNRYDGMHLLQILAGSESVLSTSVSALGEIYKNVDNIDPVPVYYTNTDVSGPPPGLFLDKSRGEVISYDTSAYKIVSWAFNESYQQTYLEGEETVDPLTQVSEEVRQTVKYGARMDPIWKELLVAYPEILQVSMGFANGVFTTYPFRTVEKTYDHTAESWYSSAVSGVKDVVIVLDRSGSMEGSKLDALKNVTREVISQLGGKDRFNIVSFSDSVKTFKTKLVSPSVTAVEQANEFINTLIPGGTTNIYLGFETALQILSEYGSPKRQSIVIFVTDGKPTTGITDRQSIVEEVGKSNGIAKAQLMMYAFGEDADYDLLSQIANVTTGYASWYNSTENLTRYVPLYHQVLSDVAPNLLSVWGKPYVAYSSLGQVATISQPVYVGDQFLGVMSVEVSMNVLTEPLTAPKTFSSQYEFVMDSGGISVVHPELLASNITEWTEENSRVPITDLETDDEEFVKIVNLATADEQVVGTVTYSDGKDYIVSMSPLGNTGLVLGTVIALNDIIPEDVFSKVDLIKIDPIVILPGLGVGLAVSVLITLVGPKFMKEDDKE